MDIMVNGEHVSCEEGITLESLVAKRGHDMIEIVTFMGGG